MKTDYKVYFILASLVCFGLVKSQIYKGCFHDQINPRYYSFHYYASVAANTVDLCIQKCRLKNFKYVGLQLGKDCYCSNFYDTFIFEGTVDDCNLPCTGNSNQICGGSLASSIYEIQNPIPIRATEIGCFQDSNRNRDLPFIAYKGDVNTPQLCWALCYELNFEFTGLQNGNECWCGQTYGKHGSLDSKYCGNYCYGNSHHQCGGRLTNKVFQLQITRPVTGRYIGCYSDAKNRDFEFYANLENYITPQSCWAYCFKFNYRYSALQYGKDCWCGNQFGKYGGANNCDVRCNGDSNQFCGGSWANAVYEIGLAEGSLLSS